MRKIFLLVLLLVLVVGVFSLAKTVWAQKEATPAAEEEIYTPRLLPDNPFYFLKGMKEGIELFLARAPERQAEKLAEIATRRIAEAKVMTKKGKPEFVDKLMVRYQEHLERAMERVAEAKEKGRDVERVIEIVTQATSQHQGVLSEVLEKVPEKAKEAIQRAIEVSGRGQQQALEAVSGEKREELREKINEKIKERPKIKEILKEKAPEVLERLKKRGIQKE